MLVSNSPTNARLIEDVQYIVSASIPSAPVPNVMSSSLAITGSTPSLDFLQAVPFPTTEFVLVRIDVPIILGTSSSAAITFNLQHSDDNVTFVDIPQLSNAIVTSTDSAGTGSSGFQIVSLQYDGKRYVRAKVSVPASGSSRNGLTGSYTASVLF